MKTITNVLRNKKRKNIFFWLVKKVIIEVSCVLVLILYVPVNNFSAMLGQVCLCLTSCIYKQGLMCLA